MKAPFQLDRIYPVRPRATISDLRRDFGLILVAAKEMGICDETETEETLSIRSKKLEWFAADEYVLANDFAKTLLKSIAQALKSAHRSETCRKKTGRDPSWTDADGKEHSMPAAQDKHRAAEQIAHLAGYFSAIEDLREERTRLAAAKRREAGINSRARLRQAAGELRGTMSRDAAAAKLADRLGKSPGTLRRQLSEEFPGAMWTRENDAALEGGKK